MGKTGLSKIIIYDGFIGYNKHVVIFNNITMLKLQNSLASSRPSQKKTSQMFSMAHLHSSQNSHTSSTNSIIMRKKYHNFTNKLPHKSNQSTASIIQPQMCQSRQLYTKKIRAAKDSLLTAIKRSNDEVETTSVKKRNMLEIEIENYSQRRYVSQRNLKSVSTSLNLVPTRSIQYKSIDIHSKNNYQAEGYSGKKYGRNYRKANKRSVTERDHNGNNNEPKNIVKSKEIYKSIENLQGKEKIKKLVRKQGSKGSRRRLKSHENRYESSSIIRSRQNSQQSMKNKEKLARNNHSIQKDINKKKEKQEILDIQRNSSAKLKYFQSKNQKKPEKTLQKQQPNNKSKRRILTEITPKKQGYLNNNQIQKVASACLPVYPVQSHSNQTTHIKNEEQFQRVIPDQNHVIGTQTKNSLLDFSSILEINESSFLSDAGKKIFFQQQDSQLEKKVTSSQKKKMCLKKIDTALYIAATKDSHTKKKPEKGGRYFDQNLEPINLQAYRSIPINSIAQHQNFSKKNILHKNVMDKIKRAFPKGFFDG